MKYLIISKKKSGLILRINHMMSCPVVWKRWTISQTVWLSLQSWLLGDRVPQRFAWDWWWYLLQHRHACQCFVLQLMHTNKEGIHRHIYIHATFLTGNTERIGRFRIPTDLLRILDIHNSLLANLSFSEKSRCNNTNAYTDMS